MACWLIATLSIGGIIFFIGYVALASHLATEGIIIKKRIGYIMLGIIVVCIFIGGWVGIYFACLADKAGG